MFHKVKTVKALKNYILKVSFIEGTTKLYDVKRLFNLYPSFLYFENHQKEFYDVHVDVGGYAIVWNDDLDIACEELWCNGRQVP